MMKKKTRMRAQAGLTYRVFWTVRVTTENQSDFIQAAAR
jgi:hypothetical protein